MQLAVTHQDDSKYRRFGGYLQGQHFGLMLGLAIVLHLLAVGVYQMLPREIIEEIPVRVLNIKIGKNLTAPPAASSIEPEVKRDAVPEEAKAAPKPKPAPPPKPKAVEKPKPKPAPKKPVVPEKPKPVVQEKPKPAPEPQVTEEAAEKRVTISEAAAQPKRYVREDKLTSKPGEGTVFGNSKAESAEIESRYTQTLSLWFNRFKVYPMEARLAGIGGTVMLRIRIDRQGTIQRYYLEHPSGHKIIDEAISTMVNSANPVPAVPPNYPDTRPYLEFLVPIHFKP